MNASSTYEVLTTATLPAYIRSQPWLASLVDASTLTVREIGDGNLNLVFICRDSGGRGICVKQSVPYVRLVGESWPLTPYRAAAEARSFDVASAAAPELIPMYHGFDRERFVLAMEDLSDCAVWRTALNRGEINRGIAGQLGEYVARMTFATSVFGLQPEEVQRRAAEATNPELCRITEDLVFTEPYIDHVHNSYVPELAPDVERLKADGKLIAEVGELKYRFMTAGQALIHGDLHTGSVMVRVGPDGACHGKVIDGEFCYYGPVGFDLGALFANYLAAYARARVLGRPDEFVGWIESLPAETWVAFEHEIRRQWPMRADPFLSDGFLEEWLAEIRASAIGYGGCKAIRRIIGLAKVSDIQTLSPTDLVEAATIVLRTAHRWILERQELSSPAELLSIAADVTSEVLS
jgi:5-methylthioribose kinase